jgi:3',5'-cyclic AMP phosphodiesterase CpdA
VVLHHHLVPIQPVEQPGDKPKRPVSVTLDAAELLREMQAAGVSLVMHGHQHRPDAVKVARYRSESESKGFEGEDMYVFAAGSAGSRELPRHVRNTYSLFTFGQNDIKCDVRNLDPEGVYNGSALEAVVPIKTSKPS